MIKKLILSLVLAIMFSISGSAKTISIHIESTATLDTSEVFTMVEVMPEIEGGIQEVYKHIEYPRAARAAEIEGRVFIKFIVDENGSVSNPQVLKDIGAGCGDATEAA